MRHNGTDDEGEEERRRRRGMEEDTGEPVGLPLVLGRAQEEPGEH